MPLFLIGFASWLIKAFGGEVTRRAFKAAAGVFYFTSFFVTLGLLAAMFAFTPTMPASVSTSLSILSPSDWAGQLAIIVSARVTSLAWAAFRQAFYIASV